MTQHVKSLVGDWREVSLLQALALLIIGAISAVCGLWVSDKTPPTLGISVRPVVSVIAPGSMLQVRYDIERYRSCASRIDRILFDGEQIRYTLADMDYAAAPGPLGRDTFVVDVPIPTSFSNGPAIYRVISRYECNVLHRLWPIVVSQDVPFEVRRHDPP